MPEELDDELQEMYEDPKRREKTLSNEVLRLPIKALRLQDAISVSPSTTVQSAVEKMQRHNIGCVLVVESKKLTGIFTERDLLQKVLGKISDLSSVPVSSYSTRKSGEHENHRHAGTCFEPDACRRLPAHPCGQ